MFRLTYRLWLGFGFSLIVIIILTFYLKSIKTIAVFSSCKDSELCFAVGTISLRSNKTFEYFYDACLENYRFNGTWRLSKDTLILNGKSKRFSFNQTRFIISEDSVLKIADSSSGGYRIFFKVTKEKLPITSN